MLNTVILMGRLTSGPELRYTPNDIAVTSFTLAVERSYVKSGTDRQVDFNDEVVWRQTAECVCNKRKAFEVVAESVHFAESKKDKSNEPIVTIPRNDDFEEIISDDDLPFN